MNIIIDKLVEKNRCFRLSEKINKALDLGEMIEENGVAKYDPEEVDEAEKQFLEVGFEPTFTQRGPYRFLSITVPVHYDRTTDLGKRFSAAEKAASDEIKRQLEKLHDVCGPRIGLSHKEISNEYSLRAISLFKWEMAQEGYDVTNELNGNKEVLVIRKIRDFHNKHRLAFMMGSRLPQQNAVEAKEQEEKVAVEQVKAGTVANDNTPVQQFFENALFDKQLPKLIFSFMGGQPDVRSKREIEVEAKALKRQRARNAYARWGRPFP